MNQIVYVVYSITDRWFEVWADEDDARIRAEGLNGRYPMRTNKNGVSERYHVEEMRVQ